MNTNKDQSINKKKQRRVDYFNDQKQKVRHTILNGNKTQIKEALLHYWNKNEADIVFQANEIFKNGRSSENTNSNN